MSQPAEVDPVVHAGVAHVEYDLPSGLVEWIDRLARQRGVAESVVAAQLLELARERQADEFDGYLDDAEQERWATGVYEGVA